MSYSMNRRNWLKTSVAAVAGLSLAQCSRPGELGENLQLAAEPIPPPSDVIKISSNENPWGISDKTKKAIEEAINLSNRYAGGARRELTNLIAEREKVEPENIIMGAGSTEILYLSALHYSIYGGEVVMADPSYPQFKNYFSKVGGNLRLVPVDEEYKHDLAAMEEKINRSTKLVFVCNPNNPTATILNGNDLYSWCREASKRTTIFVDEAYHELVNDPTHRSMTGLVREGRNVIVARTFSKIYGLAGLRIGYGIANPQIISDLRRIQTNFSSVSVLSMHAALASYKDKEFTSFTKKKNIETRAYLTGELEKMGYFYVPSHTNFVLFRIDRKARDFADELKEKNILVRTVSFNKSEWIRVSIGTPDEIQKFVEVLIETV
ncbi:histidinol-phosphate transaminase [candidate division KSB1 bacterium]|nr:histidinol-phosphate transaminase [candidate division KSB1 bacterium]